MACLDTDLLVAFMRGEPDAVRFMRACEDVGEAMSTTAVSAVELYRGAHLSAHPEESSRDVDRILGSLGVLALDHAAAREAGRIDAAAQRAGRPPGAMDALIAGIAIANGEVLVTRNARHFSRVEGLRTETW